MMRSPARRKALIRGHADSADADSLHEAGSRAVEPRIEPTMKAWHQGECALLRSGVREVKNALRAEGNRSREAHIPMQIGAAKHPARTLRHIEARTIRAHPEVRRSPKLGERFVYPPRLTIRREGRMLKELHHDAVIVGFIR